MDYRFSYRSRKPLTSLREVKPLCFRPCRQRRGWQPLPPSEPMSCVHAFRPVFLWPIPHLTEPDWDPVCAPRLAGFPVKICYADLRGERGPEKGTY
jgi:hypothetical protein